MNPWLETAVILGLGGGGATAGLWCARASRRIWCLGYMTALAFFLLCAAATCDRRLDFLPPLSLVGGRALGALKSAGAAFLLAALIPRLALARDRWAVGLLSVLLVLKVSAWPFLAPAFNRTALAHLETRIDADGVCRQQTDYTCGPAAAVTALRRLGYAAEEGELAIGCRTTEAAGTPPNILRDALQARYGDAGLTCEYHWFRRVDELPRDAVALALMKFGVLLDHYVAVLEVAGDRVVVGDPLLGKRALAAGEFEAQWRHVAVVLRGDARGGAPR